MLAMSREAVNEAELVIRQTLTSSAKRAYLEAKRDLAANNDRVNEMDALATWIYKEAKRNSKLFPDPLIQ
jgi:hypothetical protein